MMPGIVAARVPGHAPQLRGTYSVGELSELCEHYHGSRGRFAYDAFTWANAHVYDGRLPVPLVQWALTPYGHCIAYTLARRDHIPVITLHPQAWKRGRRYTLDLVIHELMHVQIRNVLGEDNRRGQKSSHDNPTWCAEIMRVSPRLDVPSFVAAPTRRYRDDGRLRRRTPPGTLSLKQLSGWPHTLRPAGYYPTTVGCDDHVPFAWPPHGA